MNYYKDHEIGRLFKKEALIHSLIVAGCVNSDIYNSLVDKYELDICHLTEEELKNYVEGQHDSITEAMNSYIESLATNVKARMLAMLNEYYIIIEECRHCGFEVSAYRSIEEKFNSAILMFLINENKIKNREIVYNAVATFIDNKVIPYEEAAGNTDLADFCKYTEKLYNEVKK